jgi:ubiquinone/menaquinone biosynthesis C-methylase UbiE
MDWHLLFRNRDETISRMNLLHRWICRSAYWKKTVTEQILPWVLEDIDLGADVLEVGPGPGLTTDLLRDRCAHLTALEVDAKMAELLQRRLGNGRVRVVHGDGTAMPFPDSCFSGAVAFTMLHHVPSAALQDQLLREVARVLKPGAVFAGTDSLASTKLRIVHIGDTYVPVDPNKFPERLQGAGFRDVEVGRGDTRFRFRARRA